LRAQQPTYPDRNDESGFSTSRQPAKRWQIEMVVMIVAEEHSTNCRKVFPLDARTPNTPRSGPGHRTRTLGPNRIRQNVGTSLLKKHGRMVHQRDAQPAFDARRRYR